MVQFTLINAYKVSSLTYKSRNHSWLPFQVAIGNVIGLDTCVIDCSKSNVQHLTADPLNCKNYYICYDSFLHSVYPFTCEGNQFFDIDTRSCRESSYACTPECEKCLFECSLNEFGKKASEVDCGIYYDCGTGKWVTCSAGDPFFDGSICQQNEGRCCSCKPRCTSDDAINHNMIPDHRNCTNFYLCLEPGIPQTHGHCQSGNFDPQERYCNTDVPCIQPCAWGHSQCKQARASQSKRPQHGLYSSLGSSCSFRHIQPVVHVARAITSLV